MQRFSQALLVPIALLVTGCWDFPGDSGEVLTPHGNVLDCDEDHRGLFGSETCNRYYSNSDIKEAFSFAVGDGDILKRIDFDVLIQVDGQNDQTRSIRASDDYPSPWKRVMGFTLPGAPNEGVTIQVSAVFDYGDSSLDDICSYNSGIWAELRGAELERRERTISGVCVYEYDW